MNAKNNPTSVDNDKTETVTIISLWTRRMRGPEALHRYDVSVPVRPIREMLSEAYDQTNIDGRPMECSICATTSGDLMVVDGVYYLVATRGFRRLTSDQAANEIWFADTSEWLVWSTRSLRLEQQPGVDI